MLKVKERVVNEDLTRAVIESVLGGVIDRLDYMEINDIVSELDTIEHYIKSVYEKRKGQDY